MNPDSYNSSMPQFIKYENSYKYIDDQSKIQSKKCDKCNKYYEMNTMHVCNNTSFTFGNSSNAQSQFTFGSKNNAPSQFTFGNSNNAPSSFTFGSINNTSSKKLKYTNSSPSYMS
jgi:hypothetical protein